MAHFDVELPCRWPAARAYSYMADLRNLRHWDPSVTRVDLLAGDPGRTGSRFAVVVAAGLRPLTLRYETTATTPTSVTVSARTAWLESVDTMTVTAARGGDGSTVRYEAELRLRGPLAVFDPLLARSFGRLATKAAAGLRRVLQEPA